MIKKLIFGFIIMFLVVLTGCNNNATTTNSTGGTQNTSSTIEEGFVNFSGSNPAILSGNGNRDFTLSIPEGGFLMRMKTPDLQNGLKDLEIISSTSGIGLSFYSPYGSGRDENNWYIYERVEHMYSAEDYIFRVEATGPYIIEVYLLPNSTLTESLPFQVNGSGTRVIGSFSASGDLTIHLRTSDAKQAGFVATLVDAETGQYVDSIYMNIENSQVINTFDVTETINVESGTYFIHINSNGRCEWELDISN